MIQLEHGECRLARLRDGRLLAWQRYGLPEGRPVYFFHGFPGSRLQAAFLAEDARNAGVALFSFDRPGFGRSTAAPKRTLLDWADDVEQLADQLRHGRFDVVGVSCGGPYALACAHRLGTRVDHVALLAGIGLDLPRGFIWVLMILLVASVAIRQ